MTDNSEFRLKNEKEFETSNLDFAAYCLYHGSKMLGRRRENMKVIITFKANSQNAEDILLDYFNNSEVKAKKFMDCYHSIKDFALKK